MSLHKSKLSFNIEDILCPNWPSACTIKSKADSSSDFTTPNDLNVPKNQTPVLPTVLDLSTSKHQASHKMPQLQLPSSTTLLDQNAKLFQKVPVTTIWPFYSHPYIEPPLAKYDLKRKGGQIRFSPQQTKYLERIFSVHKYISPEDKKHLTIRLNLSDQQVKTWFQNRRAKWRRNICSVTSNQNKPNEAIILRNLQKWNFATPSMQIRLS